MEIELINGGVFKTEEELKNSYVDESLNGIVLIFKNGSIITIANNKENKAKWLESKVF